MSTLHTKLSTGEITVPSSSFKQRTDMNIQPTPVDVTLGNIPQHWLNTQPLSRHDLKTSPSPVEDIEFNSAPEKHRILRFEEYDMGHNKGQGVLNLNK